MTPCYLLAIPLALVGLYALAVFVYVLILRWLCWSTTSQSNGFFQDRLKQWERCHAGMAKAPRPSGGEGVEGWLP